MWEKRQGIETSSQHTHTHIPTCKTRHASARMALLMPTHIPGGVTIQMSAGRQRFVVGTGVRAVEWSRFFFLFSPSSLVSPPSRAFSDWSVGGEQLGVRRGGEGMEARRRGGEGRALGRSLGAQLAPSIPELTASLGVRQTPHLRVLLPRRDARLLHGQPPRTFAISSCP